MLVFEEGGKTGGSRGKKPSAQGQEHPTYNKLNPHMMPGTAIKPRPHWWEASALTTISSLLPPK